MEPHIRNRTGRNIRKVPEPELNSHSTVYRTGQDRPDKNTRNSKDRIRIHIRNTQANNRGRDPNRPNPNRRIRNPSHGHIHSHRRTHNHRDTRRNHIRGQPHRILSRRHRLCEHHRRRPHDLRRHRDWMRRNRHYQTLNMQVKLRSFAYVTHALRLSLPQDGYEWLKCTSGGAFRPAIDIVLCLLIQLLTLYPGLAKRMHMNMRRPL